MCGVQINETSLWVKIRSFVSCVVFFFFLLSFFLFFFYVTSSRHLTCVGRQIDVRLQRHNNVGVRLILKVCMLSKLDVNLTC